MMSSGESRDSYPLCGRWPKRRVFGRGCCEFTFAQCYDVDVELRTCRTRKKLIQHHFHENHAVTLCPATQFYCSMIPSASFALVLCKGLWQANPNHYAGAR